MLAWEEFLKKQEEELGKETTNKWLRPLKVVHFDACNLYLEAKDSLHSLWFEEHIRHKIKGKFLNNNHRPIKVHLTVAEEPSHSPIKKIKKNQPPLFKPLYHPDQLDPFATLENFVPGASNQIPLQLLKELLQAFRETPKETSRETLFNPIYLYGVHGIGKSHLLMALAHAFRQKGGKAIYVRTETFTEHVVSAIRNGTMREFRENYRNADILIIDEIDDLARRSATQEELFHTFNTLHTSRRPILLAGRQLPSKLEEIEPRLISRFEWGICLQIEKLTPEETLQLLKKRLEILKTELNEELQTYLISRFTSSPHALIQALEALILRSDHPASLSIESVESLLKDLISLELQNGLNPSKIIHYVATYYGITTEDILGKSQLHECVLPRQVAMFLCRQELKLPFQKIGRLFSRDHSTVMTSIKAIQKQLESQDHTIQDLLDQLKYR